MSETNSRIGAGEARHTTRSVVPQWHGTPCREPPVGKSFPTRPQVCGKRLNREAQVPNGNRTLREHADGRSMLDGAVVRLQTFHRGLAKASQIGAGCRHILHKTLVSPCGPGLAVALVNGLSPVTSS